MLLSIGWTILVKFGEKNLMVKLLIAKVVTKILIMLQWIMQQANCYVVHDHQHF